MTSIDRLKTTILPFVYEAKEWPKPPRDYLQEYVNRMGLCNYAIFYVRDNTIFESVQMSLFIGGELYEASQNFYKIEIAEHNIIILALINIFGYCDSAKELHELINAYKYPIKAAKGTKRSRKIV